MSLSSDAQDGILSYLPSFSTITQVSGMPADVILSAYHELSPDTLESTGADTNASVLPSCCPTKTASPFLLRERTERLNSAPWEKRAHLLADNPRFSHLPLILFSEVDEYRPRMTVVSCIFLLLFPPALLLRNEKQAAFVQNINCDFITFVRKRKDLS